MEEETEEQQSAAASSQKTVLSLQSTKTGCAPIAASTTSTTTTRVSVVAADADATAAATAGGDAVPVDSSDDDDDDGADIGVVANVVTTTVKETTPPASVASAASVAASSSSSPAVKKIITTTTTTTTTTIAAATTGDDDDDDDKVVVYNTTTSNERRNRSASAKKKRFRNSNLNRPCGGSSSSPSSSSTTTGRTASLTASMNSSNNNTLTYQSGSVSTLGSRSSGGGGAAAAAAASPRAYSRKKSNGSSRNSAASSRSSGSSDSNASASPAALSPPVAAAAAGKGSPSSSSSWLMEHRRAEVDRHKQLLAQRIREHAIGLREEQELAQQIRRAEADLQRAAALAQQRQQQQQQQDAQSSTSNSSGCLNNQKRAAAAAGKRPTDLQQQRQETAPRSAAAAAATTTVTSAVAGRRGGQPEMSYKSTSDNGSSDLNDQKPSSSSSSSKTALLDPTTADAASGASSTSSTAGLTTTATAAASPSTTTTNARAKPGAYRVSGFNYFGSCSTLDTTGLDTINDDDENQPRPITAVSSLQATLVPEQQEQSVSSASAAAIAPTAAAAATTTPTTPNANNNPDNNILCAELVDEDAMQLRAEQQAAVALQRMMDQAPVAQAMADDDVVDSRARRLAQRKKKRMRKCIVTWTILVVVMVNITVAAVVAYGMGFFDNIVNTGGQNDDSSSPPNPETTSSSFWNQIGSNIDGVQASEAFGAALGISADGNTLVASAPRFLGGGSGDGMNTTGSIGHVRAYRYHAQDDEWKRLGQDLEGRLPNEKFGNRLSLSPNGKLLAIASSSSSAGVVRIFGLSETNNDSANRSANEEESVDVWGQFGLDIVSPHNSSWFGQSLSIMDNFVLAVGDVAYPTTSMNVTNDDDRGRVLMFQFNTSQREWVPMGAEINAARSATAFGQSLQLAMDKNGILVLAVGELHQNVDDDDDDAPVGHASMYRYDQAVDSWIPFGADFQGDGEFGATVALSADGSMLVVGEARMNNDTTTTSGRNSTGIVIFLHNETATDGWTRIGMDVEGAEEGQSELGSFLALSADGKVLATTFRRIESGFGQVLIWDFIANQDGSGTWSQRGPALQTTNNGGMLDFRVALSALGDRVAVSNVVASNEAGVETGHLQVFESDPIAGPLPGCCQAFSTTLELQAAVSDYLIATVEDGRKVTLVKAKYGEKIGEWDVSSISSFEYLFDAERTPEAATFNEDVSSWNVGNAKRMTGMFRGASSFNQDLSSWNVSHVEDMVSMFQDAIALNQSLCSWGLLLDASIVNVSFAFANATSCPRTKDPDLVNNSPPGPFCAVCKP
jgi:surface protein